MFIDLCRYEVFHVYINPHYLFSPAAQTAGSVVSCWSDLLYRVVRAKVHCLSGRLVMVAETRIIATVMVIPIVSTLFLYLVLLRMGMCPGKCNSMNIYNSTTENGHVPW